MSEVDDDPLRLQTLVSGDAVGASAAAQSPSADNPSCETDGVSAAATAAGVEQRYESGPGPTMTADQSSSGDVPGGAVGVSAAAPAPSETEVAHGKVDPADAPHTGGFNVSLIDFAAIAAMSFNPEPLPPDDGMVRDYYGELVSRREVDRWGFPVERRDRFRPP